MSIINKIRKLSLISLNLQNFIFCTKYIFIFSHMRSRSSVLSHILGSNPEICGYSELGISYLDYIDLMRMKIDLTVDLKCSFNNKYLLDKVLHNYYEFPEKIFKVTKPKIIFLLREPENTIKSIVNLGFIANIECYKDPIYALDYYCSRLKLLEEYSKLFPCEYFFIESDDLIKNPDFILENLSRWLNLNKALDKNYSIFNNTGIFGKGDPSQNIKSGILKESRNYSDIKIPLEVLQIGKSAYEKCKDSLMKKPTTNRQGIETDLFEQTILHSKIPFYEINPCQIQNLKDI